MYKEFIESLTLFSTFTRLVNAADYANISTVYIFCKHMYIHGIK